MKKILFIIPTLQGGGAEKLLSDILRNFDYSSYEVHLMYFYENNIYLDGLPKEVKLTMPFCIKNSLFEKVKRGCLKIFHLEDCARREKIRRTVDGHYDTIISFLEGMALHFHTFLTDRAYKNISFVHTDINKYRISLNNASEREYGMMDSIAFVSKQAKVSFEGVFPENKASHMVLPNFIDTETVLSKSAEQVVEKDCPTFICVGRMEKVKGFDILVDIAKILKTKMTEFVFRLVGKGVEEDWLKAQVEKAGLSNHFVFEGFKSNPYPYIAVADVMLSTSLAEGFSLVICEAMALGVPVISSKTDGAKSLLYDDAGILVDRTSENYAKAIIGLLDNRQAYEGYVQRGRERSKLHDKAVYMPRFYNIL